MNEHAASLAVACLPPRHLRALRPLGRAALESILRGRWLWSPCSSLPGRHRVARRLARLGWVELWGDFAATMQATLTPRAAALLDVAIDEFGSILWSTITEYDDDDADGKLCPHQELQEFDRWVPASELRAHYYMPRTRDMAELPPDVLPARAAPIDPEFVESFVAALAADVPAPAPPLTPAQRRKILGVFVGELKRRRPSKKGVRRAACA